MLPSGSSQLPGGRHEGVVVKMRVPTLGSSRHPVASAPAPGAVPAWARFWGHGPSEMFIFTRFYKGSRPDLGQDENVDFPMVFYRVAITVDGPPSGKQGCKPFCVQAAWTLRKPMIFNSFWEWAVFSLETIEKFKLDIAIKPHPNSLYQTRRFVEQLQSRFTKVRWIDHRISNRDIFNSGIKFGVSVYGSILLELAYHNIIPIASTRYHPYSNYKFVYTPRNLSDYKNFLIKPHKLKKNVISKREIEEFYYMQTFYNHDGLKNTARSIQLKDFKNTGSIGLINYLDKIKKTNIIQKNDN